MHDIVQCPACKKSSRLPEGYVGPILRCPHCKGKFTYVVSAKSSRAAPGPDLESGSQPAPRSHASAAPHSSPPVSEAVQPTASASHDRFPAQIGRFQIRARLGAGAFGTVYRAYDPQLEREVALKVPQASALEGTRTVQRFLREAKAAARLRHPHIVPVHEAGHDSSHYYIAAAFIEGDTLARVIDENPLDFHRAAQIVRDLAEALAYAHGLGIVHRDVKPANIMLDSKDEPHLMDFGLAHRQDLAEKLTHDGAILGTPAYIAPEQAGGQKGDAQPASDQYSLGVVLYELLCQRTPFDGPPQIVLFNAIHTEPTPPRKLNGKVPLDLETICLKAMAKRAADRYASCQEMADDLRRWLEGEPIRVRRLSVVEKLVRWGRRNPAVAGLTAAVLFTTTLGLLLVTLQWRKASAAAAAEHHALTELRANQQTLVEAKNAAEKERTLALEQRTEATRQRDVAQRQAYAAKTLLADRAFNEVQYQIVQNYLKSTSPQPGHSDNRSWEWYYLSSSMRRLKRAYSWTDKAGSLAYSPDGRYLAALNIYSGHPPKVWDTASGKEVGRFPAVTLGDVNADCKPLAWSPDSRLLAVGSPVSLFAVPSTAKVRELGKDYGTVQWVGWSPDGRKLAVVSSDRKTRILDANSWSIIQTLETREGKPCCGAWASDSEHFVVGHLGDDERKANLGGFIAVWHASTGKSIRTIQTGAREMALQPRGNLLVVPVPGSTGSRIWDIQSGKQIIFLPNPGGGVFQPRFSHSGKQLAIPSIHGDVWVWDAESGFQSASIYRWLTHWCRRADFTPDSPTLVCGGEDRVVEMDLSGRPETRVFQTTRRDSPQTLAFSADSTLLASGYSDRIVRFWDTQSGRITRELSVSGTPTGLAFSPDGNHLAISDTTGVLTLAPVRTKPDEKIHIMKIGDILDIVWGPDPSKLVVIGKDGQLSVVSAKDGTTAAQPKTPLRSAATVAICPDRSQLAVGDDSGNLVIMKLPDLQTVYERKFDDTAIVNLSWHPNDKFLAIALKGRPGEVWDIHEGRKLFTLTGACDVAGQVAWSHDGKRLATSLQLADRAALFRYGVSIWDAELGNELFTLSAARVKMRSLVWAKDNRQLAAAGEDGLIRIWDASDGYADQRGGEPPNAPR